jgi:hypothetical protein
MRELLIRYLLGELDADERRELQSRLQNSPELRQELAYLRSCFESHQEGDLPAIEPPSNLAARTAGRVTGCDEEHAKVAKLPETRFAPAGDSPPGFLGWSLADLTVAGGVMLAVCMLIFPALRNSRDGTRREMCKNNQRQLWFLLTDYADKHGKFFPKVRPGEHAGIFAARLIAAREVHPKDLAVLLVCPGAPLADKFRSGELELRLPTAEAIHKMTDDEVEQVAAVASPFYSYCFPWQTEDGYHYIKDERRMLAPLISDTPGDDPNNPMSPNHGDRFVQVLSQDGRVMQLTSCQLPGVQDNMFLNDLGLVAAGVSSEDAVLGPTNATPGFERKPTHAIKSDRFRQQ